MPLSVAYIYSMHGSCSVQTGVGAGRFEQFIKDQVAAGTKGSTPFIKVVVHAHDDLSQTNQWYKELAKPETYTTLFQANQPYATRLVPRSLPTKPRVSRARARLCVCVSSPGDRDHAGRGTATLSSPPYVSSPPRPPAALGTGRICRDAAMTTDCFANNFIGKGQGMTCVSRKRAVIFFRLVFVLISFGGQAPHVLRAHMGHTCRAHVWRAKRNRIERRSRIASPLS